MIKKILQVTLTVFSMVLASLTMPAMTLIAHAADSIVINDATFALNKTYDGTGHGTPGQACFLNSNNTAMNIQPPYDDNPNDGNVCSVDEVGYSLSFAFPESASEKTYIIKAPSKTGFYRIKSSSFATMCTSDPSGSYTAVYSTPANINTCEITVPANTPPTSGSWNLALNTSYTRQSISTDFTININDTTLPSDSFTIISSENGDFGLKISRSPVSLTNINNNDYLIYSGEIVTTNINLANAGYDRYKGTTLGANVGISATGSFDISSLPAGSFIREASQESLHIDNNNFEFYSKASQRRKNFELLVKKEGLNSLISWEVGMNISAPYPSTNDNVFGLPASLFSTTSHSPYGQDISSTDNPDIGSNENSSYETSDSPYYVYYTSRLNNNNWEEIEFDPSLQTSFFQKSFASKTGPTVSENLIPNFLFQKPASKPETDFYSVIYSENQASFANTDPISVCDSLSSFYPSLYDFSRDIEVFYGENQISSLPNSQFSVEYYTEISCNQNDLLSNPTASNADSIKSIKVTVNGLTGFEYGNKTVAIYLPFKTKDASSYNLTETSLGRTSNSIQVEGSSSSINAFMYIDEDKVILRNYTPYIFASGTNTGVTQVIPGEQYDFESTNDSSLSLPHNNETYNDENYSYTHKLTVDSCFIGLNINDENTIGTTKENDYFILTYGQTTITQPDYGPDGTPCTNDDVSGWLVEREVNVSTKPGFSRVGITKAPSSKIKLTGLLSPWTTPGTTVNTAITTDSITETTTTFKKEPVTSLAASALVSNNPIASQAKIVSDSRVESGKDFEYQLIGYNTTDAAISNMRLIDIFPYNQDTNGSSLSSQISNISVSTIGNSANPPKIWLTSKDSATINSNVEDQSNIMPNPDWCELGTSGCSNNGQFTGIIIEIPTLSPNSHSGAKIIINTAGQENNDIFKNRLGTGYLGSSSSEILPSAIRNTEIYFNQIQGKVFSEISGDGNYDNSDVLVANYNYEILNENNEVVHSGQTDNNGSYSFSSLPSGNYTIKFEDLDTNIYSQVNSIGNIGINNTPTTSFAFTSLGGNITNVDLALEIVPNPSMIVNKTVDKTNAQIGETVTYTISVNNNGNIPYLPIVDDPDCEITGDLNSKMNPGTTREFTCEKTFTSEDFENDNTFINTVTVTGYTGGENDIQETSSVAVSKINSSITTSYSYEGLNDPRTNDNPDHIEPGETVRYKITVNNTGDVTFKPEFNSDFICDNSFSIEGSNVLLQNNQMPEIQPGNSIVIVCERPANTLNDIKNSYTVKANDNNPDTQDPSASEIIEVDVREYSPNLIVRGVDLNLEPTNGIFIPGTESIYWEIKGSLNSDSNSSSEADYVFNANYCNEFGEIENGNWVPTTPNTLPNGNITGTTNADSNQTFVIYCKTNIPSGMVLENGKTLLLDVASLSPYFGQSPLSAPIVNDLLEITPLEPTFDIEKTSNVASASVNENITWEFTLVNTSPFVMNYTVSDEKCPNVKYLDGADATNIQDVNPGDTIQFTCTDTMKNSDTGAYINTVTVSGIAKGSNTPIIKNANAQVAVKGAYIRVKTEADKTSAYPGETVNFTTTVTNNGGTPYIPTITNSNCSFEGDFETQLMPGDSREYTCSYEMNSSDSNNDLTYTNIVSFAGVDGNSNTEDPTDSDSVVIGLKTHGISIEKIAEKEKLLLGETSKYKITIKNYGVEEREYSLNDDSCTTLTPSGHSIGENIPGSDGNLPGTHVYTCEHVITNNDVSKGGHFNTATLNYTNPVNGETVNKTSSAVTSTIINSLTVNKTANKTKAVEGETIIFTILVKNAGQVDFYPVISDDNCGAINGDTDTIMTPGESREFTCSLVVNSEHVNNGFITNTVTVTGDDRNDNSTDPVVSDQATVSTGEAGLSLTKKGPDNIQVGETIEYEFIVKNTGIIGLTPSIIDPECNNIIGGEGILSAGSSTVFTCEKTFTESMAPSFTNTATVTGTADGVSVQATDSHTVTMKSSSVSVTKEVDKTQAQVGETLTYTITVTNNGDIGYTPLVDDKKCAISGDNDILSPGETREYNCTKVISYQDGLEGFVTNDVIVTGFDGKEKTTDPQDTASVTTDIISSELMVTKQVDKINAQIGETLNYTIKVINNGERNVKPVIVDDQCDEIVGDLDNFMAPSEEREFTCSHTLNQEDGKNASYVNKVTVTGNDELPETNDPVVKAIAITNIKKQSISITKKVIDEELSVTNGYVSWEIIVKNDGEIPYSYLVTDNNCSNLSPTDSGNLESGESMTMTCQQNISENDIAKGYVFNNASVSVDDGIPGTSDVSEAITSKAVLNGPGFIITKTADKEQAQIGEKITYTINVKNGAYFPVTANISDLGCSNHSISPVNGSITQNLSGKGNNGDSISFTCEYTMTENDFINNGYINEATVSSEAFTDAEGIKHPAMSATANNKVYPLKSGISVIKKADKTAAYSGETVNFTITVTNTGQVSYRPNVEDEGCKNLSGDMESNLEPGENRVFTCDYIMGETVNGNAPNVSSGYTNTVKVTGIDDLEETVNPTATDSFTIVYKKFGLSIDKIANNSALQEGQTAKYTINIYNYGNEDVSYSLVDNGCININPVGHNIGDNIPATPGAVPGKHVYECEYKIQDIDISNGGHTNIAEVTYNNPLNNEEIKIKDNATTTTLMNSISVEKTVNKDKLIIGETAVYTIKVKNTGQVAYKPIVQEPLCDVNGDSDSLLQPDETRIFTCEINVTQEIVNAGFLNNTVTVIGDDEVDDSVNPVAKDQATFITGENGMVVSKTSSSEFAQIGEIIDYSILVKNVGIVNAMPIIEDEKCENLDGNFGIMTPGSERVFTCSHRLTAGDGTSYTNTVFVTSDDNNPNTPNPISEDSFTTTIKSSSILLTKTSDKTSAYEGETVTYTIKVQNTGQVPYVPEMQETGCENITSTESGLLQPGSTREFTCTHVININDAENGFYTSKAKVIGNDGDENTTNPFSIANNTVRILTPGISVNKEVDKAIAQPQEKLNYTIIVKNTGNTDLVPNIVDEGCENIEGGTNTLAPDEETTYTCDYTMTSQDIAGYKNVVQAIGIDGERTVKSEDSVTTSYEQPVAFTVQKTADKTLVQKGETINYTILIKNIGTIDFEALIEEPMCPGLTSTTIEPNETKTLPCSYVVSEEDVENGSVDNTVKVTGKDGKEETTDPVITKTVNVLTGQSTMVASVSSSKSVAQEGETVTFVAKVTNNGSFNYTPIITAEGCILEDKDLPELSPGESVSIECSKEITANSSVIKPIFDFIADDNNSSTTNPKATLESIVNIVKSNVSATINAPQDLDPQQKPGDSISYTILVKNDGKTSFVPSIRTSNCNITQGDTTSLMKPNEERTYICVHVVKNEEISSGEINVSADVTGVDNNNLTYDPIATTTSIIKIESPEEPIVTPITTPTIIQTQTSSTVSPEPRTIVITVTKGTNTAKSSSSSRQDTTSNITPKPEKIKINSGTPSGENEKNGYYLILIALMTLLIFNLRKRKKIN